MTPDQEHADSVNLQVHAAHTLGGVIGPIGFREEGSSKFQTTKDFWPKKKNKKKKSHIMQEARTNQTALPLRAAPQHTGHFPLQHLTRSLLMDLPEPSELVRHIGMFLTSRGVKTTRAVRGECPVGVRNRRRPRLKDRSSGEARGRRGGAENVRAAGHLPVYGRGQSTNGA